MYKHLLIAATMLASSVQTLWAGVEKTARGMVVSIDNAARGEARTIRLSVVNDRVVRVEATPDDTFAVKNSLMIVPEALSNTASWQMSEDGSSATLATRHLRVAVDKRSGRITFTDATTGKMYLQETAKGGKTFAKYTSAQTMLPPHYTPSAPGELNWGKQGNLSRIAEENRTGYTWRAQFESSEDEAFYGLGQHQAEEMNYKGKNEELFQYNTKVSVPFVVSTRGYGLLWDSYSYGRWGNPADYQQLHRVLALCDKQGKPGALTGTYTDKNGRQVVRREDSIYFEHSGVIGLLPQEIKLNGGKVVYEGSIEAKTTADHHFILYYAGYVRVMVDGKEVVAERWRTAWNPNAYKFVLPLEKGRKAALRIEWKPDGDVSYCGLRVAVPQSREQQNRVSIWNEMAKYMDYYFICGNDMDEVIGGYRTLTGRAQVMPKWALGFWQSRERYKTQREVEETLAEFRRRHIPIDNIVQDWNYWADDQWGSHEFEPSRFPNPQAMIDKVHEQHGRLMISVWPKFYCNTQHYKALDAKGWMYQQAVKDSIRDWVGPGYIGSFYDAYSAGARQLFWQQMDSSMYSRFHEGVDAWWMDASEPNVRDCTPIDYRKQLCGPTALGTSDEYFNAYSIVNADAIYHGQRSVNPNKRVFLLTRSGFAGLQRYSTATWSGDIGTRWEDMRAQMTAGLNFSMSGVPFWGMDQGGFCVENRYVKAQQLFDKTGRENSDLKEWRELQTRWNQFGCFIPLYRAHGQWPRREVWNIAPEQHPAYQSIVAYHRLRYQLMPYLYSMAGWVHHHNYTMLRGLAMDFAEDERVREIGNQWMFGPSLMACPVGAYQCYRRQVYLPKPCGWYDLFTGRHYRGGTEIEAEAPYSRIPVFVPEGAILPVGPEMEWSDEKQPEEMTLYVFAGANGKFELYEDEGTNYNYEKGAFSTIGISYDDRRGVLTIGARKGQFAGMLQHRTFHVVWVGDGVKPRQEHEGAPLILGGAEELKRHTVKYHGRQVSVKLKK